VNFLLLLRGIINRAFTSFQDVASGKDLKKFLKVPFHSLKGFAICSTLKCIFSNHDVQFDLQVIAVLWVLSVIGSWFSFLTLLYLCELLFNLF